MPPANPSSAKKKAFFGFKASAELHDLIQRAVDESDTDTSKFLRTAAREKAMRTLPKRRRLKEACA